MPWTTATTRATGFAVTATIWNSEHTDNMNFLREVNYTAYTADVAVSATTVGTANQIVSSGAITYEAVPHMIEFYCPRVTTSTGELRLVLRDSTTVIGTLGRMAASGTGAPVKCEARVTPTAASHTYNVAAWLSAAGTWTMEAGTGGAAGDATTDLAGFIRIFRVPT